jgi:hypothetical protein
MPPPDRGLGRPEPRAGAARGADAAGLSPISTARLRGVWTANVPGYRHSSPSHQSSPTPEHRGVSSRARQLRPPRPPPSAARLLAQRRSPLEMVATLDSSGRLSRVCRLRRRWWTADYGDPGQLQQTQRMAATLESSGRLSPTHGRVVSSSSGRHNPLRASTVTAAAGSAARRCGPVTTSPRTARPSVELRGSRVVGGRRLEAAGGLGLLRGCGAAGPTEAIWESAPQLLHSLAGYGSAGLRPPAPGRGWGWAKPRRRRRRRRRSSSSSISS